MATPSDRRDTAVRPPSNLYPWDQWQDGRWWTIESGKDFDCMVSSMRDQLHVRARTTGVKVKTHTDMGSKIQFIFQVAGETDETFAQRTA